MVIRRIGFAARSSKQLMYFLQDQQNENQLNLQHACDHDREFYGLARCKVEFRSLATTISTTNVPLERHP